MILLRSEKCIIKIFGQKLYIKIMQISPKTFDRSGVSFNFLLQKFSPEHLPDVFFINKYGMNEDIKKYCKTNSVDLP